MNLSFKNLMIIASKKDKSSEILPKKGDLAVYS